MGSCIKLCMGTLGYKWLYQVTKEYMQLQYMQYIHEAKQGANEATLKATLGYTLGCTGLH